MTFGEWLPNLALALSLHDEDRFTAGDFGRVMDFIIGVVGEERQIGIAPSGCQGAIAGDKHPMIGAADDAHEKRPHPVVIGNLIITLPAYFDLASFDGK